MKNNTQAELLDIIERLQKLRKKLPDGCRIRIDQGHEWVGVWVFTDNEHSVGLKVQRILGIQDMEKSVYTPDDPSHHLSASLGNNISLTIACKGLPPSCRIETYEEEISKTDVVTLAETVKVKRTRICCGEVK